LVLYFFLALGSTTTCALGRGSFEAIFFQLFTSPNALEEFTFDLKSLFWYHLSHMFTPWHRSNVTPFHSRVVLNTYVTCTWKTAHLVKLRHSNLPHNLLLTLTSKLVGLIPANFPSGPRPCSPRLPSLVFRPNRRLHLVQGLSAPRPTP
jgi:hypothetical protein